MTFRVDKYGATDQILAFEETIGIIWRINISTLALAVLQVNHIYKSVTLSRRFYTYSMGAVTTL